MQEPPLNNRFRLNPVSITIIYLAIGFLWIAYSDILLQQAVTDLAVLSRLQTVKGWFFVTVTGLLLFLLINRYKSELIRTRRNFISKFEQYKALLAHANQIIIQVNQDLSFRYVNPVIKEILGYDVRSVTHMNDLEKLVHRNDLRKFGELKKYICETPSQHKTSPVRLRVGDGSWRWFHLSVSDERRLKHVKSMLLIIRDIHDETILYEELNESKKRFEHLFQEAPVGYHSFDNKFVISDINKTELKILGYERDEVIGKKTWADFIIPEELPRLEEHKKELLEKGYVENYSYTIIKKNGERRSVILNALAFFNGKDQLLYTLGNILDITDKIRAEKELAEAYRRINYHIQNSPLGFVEWDAKFRVKAWSDESEKIFGWNSEEVINKKPEDFQFLHPRDRTRVSRLMAKLLSGDVVKNVVQNRNITRDGREVHCEWYNSVLFDRSGNVLSIMSLVHDITEKNKALDQIRKWNTTLEERILERTRELETVNREMEAFAYSVSHDLRAPLRSIDGFSQALLENYENMLDQQGKKYLARVRKASQKMGGLIDDMLSLSRISKADIKNEQVDIAEISREIIDALEEKAPEKKVNLLVPEKLVVSGDVRLLQIMMQNLLQNSWKFSFNRDEISIEIKLKTVDKSSVIIVEDNGVGFDMKYHDKLFMPFQRLHSKEEFPGTGIGLATVQRIVNRHSGTIRAESQPDKGTRFFISLPIITAYHNDHPTSPDPH